MRARNTLFVYVNSSTLMFDVLKSAWVYKDELIWVQELHSKVKGDNGTMFYELED